MELNTALWIGLAAVFGAVAAWAVLTLRQRHNPGAGAVPSGSRELTPVEANRLTTTSRPLPTSLVIENARGENAVSITQLPLAMFENVSSELIRPTPTVGRLNSLLQAAPALASASQGAREGLYEVVINGPLANARGSAGEVLQDTYRAFSHDGKKITEHALLNPAQASSLLSAAAVWQVASVIVAQKHLADISRKLDAIAKGVDDVQARMDDVRKSRIIGALSLLREVSVAVLHGELSSTLRHQLENSYADLVKVHQEILLQLSREVAALQHLQDPNTFGADGFKNAVEQERDRLGDVFRSALLCSRARLQIWSLLTIFPGEPMLKRERLAAIQSDLSTLFNPTGERMNFAKSTRTLINRIQSRFVGADSLAKEKDAMLRRQEEVEASLSAEYSAELQLLADGANLLADATSPTRLLVHQLNNEIVAIKHLPSNAAPELMQIPLQPSVLAQHAYDMAPR